MFLWKSFEDFRDDMYDSYLEHVEKHGEKQTTLDRIDVNGNYQRDNCRWATMPEQAAGRRDAVMITFQGETMNLAYWADKLGMSRCTLDGRIKKGWSVEDALTIGIGEKNKRYKIIEYRGERLNLSQFGRKYGIPQTTLSRRLIKGWSVEKALTTPLRRFGGMR